MQLTFADHADGFTLIEVLISSVVMLTLALGALQLQVSVQRTLAYETSATEFTNLTADVTRKLSNNPYYDPNTGTASSICSRALGITNGASSISINQGSMSNLTLYEVSDKVGSTVFIQPGTTRGSLQVQSLSFTTVGGSQPTSQSGVYATLGILTLTAARTVDIARATQSGAIVPSKIANIPLFLRYQTDTQTLVDCATTGTGWGNPEYLPQNCSPGMYLILDGTPAWACQPVPY